VITRSCLSDKVFRITFLLATACLQIVSGYNLLRGLAWVANFSPKAVNIILLLMQK
jgi:hypothetical protein